MQLFIDDTPIEIQEGESLLDIIQRMGLDSASLKTRPIAAKMAGEVFTLSYIPQPEGYKGKGKRIERKAVRASKGHVRLIRYMDDEGALVYERSALFIFCLSVRNLFPDATVIVQYALGNGIFIKVRKEKELTRQDVDALKEEFARIVGTDYPFKRERWNLDDAEETFRQEGQMDKVQLLEWRMFPYFDMYNIGSYHDYLYGEMTPSTGYVSAYDLKYTGDGVMLMLPDPDNFDVAAEYTPSPKLAEAFRKKSEWAEQTHCCVVNDLNDMVRNRTIRDEIRICETLHEKGFAQVADRIVARDAKAVMIAGPSSSGKTTSAHRLSVHLRMHGLNPVMLSLDDYYMDREKMVREPDGSLDLESVYALDIELFHQNLRDMLNGKEVNVPTFDFKLQKPFFDEKRIIRLNPNDILVIEGLHGLNPVMLPDGIEKQRVFRLYVSPITTLNIDYHNRIRTTQIRQLRRIVRDFETRGASVERTLGMWKSVRKGEEKWIMPFQEDADAILDTGLPYEPFVLKRYIYPLLMNVRPDSECYDEVRGIVKFLNYFLEANVEDEIPPTSILREFIGGNTFYK